MNSPTLGLRVASILFGVTGLAHLIRVFVKIQLVIGTCYIQRRWNLVAFVILAALCVWMWSLASQLAKSKQPEPPKA
ncbi:hypothetical protein GALL_276080 [mine drainage metagenome]|uniref:Uncharacterized protein n=1 Tax=mine drainage metagenome TaxID=410659 RepID=A0A1J5RQX3_9ZZZZ